ncbi:dolichyl-phosphate-mannose--protein mannosyltransferase 4 [Acrodontium crateriforme]|uniref:Dolichyl-phosphate-mannose--protein mannosyltransferase n=1 Tax=Acrodontium crateriforme TaxID=150365 RepID=A0AAQ3LY81_9PEZI|nr:dolichyl-phosphate-mannose--protein mannosyltransferase 4 [Acrodontium crateriforme]
MSSPSSARQRTKRGTTPVPDPNLGSTKENIVADANITKLAHKKVASSDWDYRLAMVIVTILGFVTRFYGISHPDQVVFDEVHFGKFASYYLQRTYFFDVHPPFGKLLFAFAGWLVGYDGAFLFENIGDNYISNKVPYVAYRSMPAMMGALTVTIVFSIMWESGYSLPACLVATALVLFDNAHIGQTRLILLDATLVLFMALSVLCYIRFYKLRHVPFSRKWWKWLLLTGVSMSCVISTKYVGAFTFFSIGVPVMIDLWDLLDVNRKQGALSFPEFGKHFAARIIGLIVIPFLMYLFWFQVHFAILTRSGPGDDFMTPEFQATLSDNLMTQQAVGIEYGDNIAMRHKDTRVYLHSHFDKYPLRYDDGRISSNSQQVTGYPHNDTNNLWQILPSTATPDLNERTQVRNGDIVRFRHIVTDSWLLTHDVASPSMPTNQEFTCVDHEAAGGDRYQDTLFEIRIENGKPGQDFKTMSSHFKLVHYPTKVAMWTHPTIPALPDWGYKQAEINGNKNLLQSTNLWFVEEVPGLPEDSPRRRKEEKKVKSLPFMQKYLELQRAMFYHNNALTSSHPYASFPIHWPFLLRGVSFWTNSETKEQIYFLGNPVGWWFASSVLAILVGILFADQVSIRRGVDALDKRARSRLYNSTGFFFLIWAAHYLPFYIMGRQLFLHHYLPAHLASALVAGAVVEFIFNIEPADLASFTDAQIQDGVKKGAKSVSTQPRPVRERIAGQSLLATWAASMAFIAVLVWAYLFFAPLTYGTPGLTVEQVIARKWLNYDLHFAK